MQYSSTHNVSVGSKPFIAPPTTFHVVPGDRAEMHMDIMESAFRLRHRVFVDQYGWKALRRADQREIDQFDTKSAIHIVAVEGERVVGYSRLLPTTEPHLLSSVYPELAAKEIPVSHSIWEWTRYCVAPEKRGQTAIGNVGSVLLYSVLKYAHDADFHKLSMQTDPLWITRFFDLGFDVDPLGMPADFDGSPVVAMTVSLTEAALQKCRRLLRIRSFEFSDLNPSLSDQKCDWRRGRHETLCGGIVSAK